MRYSSIVFLLAFAFQLSAQEPPLPKGVKSVTTYHCYIGDSVELDRTSQVIFNRNGDTTMYITFDTTFYRYDRKGNKTMMISRDTFVYKYDRKGREIERGFILKGIYMRQYVSEYDHRGRLVRRVYGEGWGELTFTYAENGWITAVDHLREENGYETWITEVTDEKGELMKSVECYRTNDTALAGRHVYDSVAVRKVGDSIYREYYEGEYLRKRDISDAHGIVTRSEGTQEESLEKWITYYDLDSNGHWMRKRSYVIDRHTGSLSVPVITTYTYDARNRLLNRGGSSGESWVYNAAGQLTEYSKGDYRTLYSYNSTGQCIEVRNYWKGTLTNCSTTVFEFYSRTR